MIIIFNDDFSFCCDTLEKSNATERTRFISDNKYVGSINFHKFYLKFCHIDKDYKYYELHRRINNG